MSAIKVPPEVEARIQADEFTWDDYILWGDRILEVSQDRLGRRFFELGRRMAEDMERRCMEAILK